jgi:hypothetical protein
MRKKAEEKLLGEELDLLANEVTNLKLNARTGIDNLKIEIDTMKRFLAGRYPHFAAQFQAFRESVILEVSPE